MRRQESGISTYLDVIKSLELVDNFARQISNYMDRFQVKLGLTGVAQVYGRYDSPPREKLRYDLFYTKHQSFLLDRF